MSAPLRPALATRRRTSPGPGAGSACAAASRSACAWARSTKAGKLFVVVDLERLGVAPLVGHEQPGRGVRGGVGHEARALALEVAGLEQLCDGGVDVRARRADRVG